MLKKARKAIDVSRLFGLLAVAAGEGFEPSQTESESVVLPLHNPAKSAEFADARVIIQYFSLMSRKYLQQF